MQAGERPCLLLPQGLVLEMCSVALQLDPESQRLAHSVLQTVLNCPGLVVQEGQMPMLLSLVWHQVDLSCLSITTVMHSSCICLQWQDMLGHPKNGIFDQNFTGIHRVPEEAFDNKIISKSDQGWMHTSGLDAHFILLVRCLPLCVLGTDWWEAIAMNSLENPTKPYMKP